MLIKFLERKGNFLLGCALIAFSRGNFSVVKEGLHRKTGKRVAIKIIEKKKFWNTPKTKEQILREVEILKGIKHENIISVIDALDTPSHMYIILEL